MKPTDLGHHPSMLAGSFWRWEWLTAMRLKDRGLTFPTPLIEFCSPNSDERCQMHDHPPMFASMDNIITRSNIFTEGIYNTHSRIPSLVRMHFSNWGRARVFVAQYLKCNRLVAETLTQGSVKRVSNLQGPIHWQRNFLHMLAECTNNKSGTSSQRQCQELRENATRVFRTKTLHDGGKYKKTERSRQRSDQSPVLLRIWNT